MKPAVRFTVCPAGMDTRDGWFVMTGGFALTTVTSTYRSDDSPLSIEVCHPVTHMGNVPLRVGIPVSVPRVESVSPGGNPLRTE